MTANPATCADPRFRLLRSGYWRSGGPPVRPFAGAERGRGHAAARGDHRRAGPGSGIRPSSSTPPAPPNSGTCPTTRRTGPCRPRSASAPTGPGPPACTVRRRSGSCSQVRCAWGRRSWARAATGWRRPACGHPRCRWPPARRSCCSASTATGPSSPPTRTSTRCDRTRCWWCTTRRRREWLPVEVGSPMRFDLGGTPQPGLFIKMLYRDQPTGFYSRLIKAKPGWREHPLAHHPFYEEAYCLEGGFQYNFGKMCAGTFFFGPPWCATGTSPRRRWGARGSSVRTPTSSTGTPTTHGSRCTARRELGLGVPGHRAAPPAAAGAVALAGRVEGPLVPVGGRLGRSSAQAATGHPQARPPHDRGDGFRRPARAAPRRSPGPSSQASPAHRPASRTVLPLSPWNSPCAWPCWAGAEGRDPRLAHPVGEPVARPVDEDRATTAQPPSTRPRPR